jgi:hypothetical protein
MTIWTPCHICERPATATDHDHGCPFTIAALIRKYGSEGKAAGAVALGVEKIPGPAFTKWHECFRSLVLFKQQTAILKLAAMAAQTSVPRLQELWRRTEEEDHV